MSVCGFLPEINVFIFVFGGKTVFKIIDIVSCALNMSVARVCSLFRA